MMDTLLWLKDGYWAHRDVARMAVATGLVILLQLIISVWFAQRLRELANIRERMSRLADGLVLLTDTTEAGLATLARQIDTLGQKRPPARTASRQTVAKRVVAAAMNGSPVADIAETEALSESEVRLHLSLADAAKTRGERRPLGA